MQRHTLYRIACIFVFFSLVIVLLSTSGSHSTEAFTYQMQAAHPDMMSLSAKESMVSRIAFSRSASPSRSESHAPRAASLDSAKSVSRKTREAIDDKGSESLLPQTQMLIKKGNLVLRSGRTKVALEGLLEATTVAVRKANGYVESLKRRTVRSRHYPTRRGTDGSEGDYEMQREQNGEQLMITLVARVPVENFQELFETCTRLPKASVEDESYNVEDVTASYVDVAARAASLQATHDQLLQLMNRAEKIPDVLEVQKHLSGVRQELESKKQQKQWLEKSTSLSTLTIELQESPIGINFGDPSPNSRWRAVDAFFNALNLWVNLLQLLVDATIYIVTLGLPLLGVVTLAYRITNKYLGEPTSVSAVRSTSNAVDATGPTSTKGEPLVSQERRQD